MIAGLLLAYSGLSLLCFSVAVFEAPPQRTARRYSPAVLYLVGGSLLCVSFSLCFMRGHGAGIVTWIGFVSVSGVLLATLRPYASRVLRMLAIVAVVSAIVVETIAAPS